MSSLMLAVATYVRAIFVRRHKLALEAAALRQQLAVFNRMSAKAQQLREDSGVERRHTETNDRDC